MTIEKVFREAMKRAVALTVLAGAPLAAQRISGTVRDLDSQGFIPAVSVELTDSLGRLVANTRGDTLGRYQLEAPRPGSYWIRTAKIGFTRRRKGPIRVENTALVVDLELSRVVQLDSVRVVESATAFIAPIGGSREIDFRRRMEKFANTRHAQFFPRDSMDAWDERGETLSRMLGRWVRTAPPRPPHCVGGRSYLDGLPSRGESLALGQIEFVEVYTFPSLPAEFMAPVLIPGVRSTGAPPCSVINIWLRADTRG